MIKYNWKTKMYEVWVQYRVGGPSVMDCDFWCERLALAYLLNARHVKC